MDAVERIQSGLTSNASLTYVLKPSTLVRALDGVETTNATRDLADRAKPLMRHAVSAMLLQNGRVVFELYNKGGAAATPINAYSMTKSLTALAVGEALCAGKIKSLDDLAQSYVPAIEGTPYGKASIRQLLMYASGAEEPGGGGFRGFHEPRTFNAMVTHRLSLVDLIKSHSGTSRFKAGEKFFYNGLDSQTLSLVIRTATGMPLPAWFEATVWKAAGAESAATWFVDKEGNGNAEILFFGTTRDFARIGQYVLDRLTGEAGDTCIQAFLKEGSKPLMAKGYWPAAPAWGYGLHTGADGNVWMFGHNGQRVGISVATKRVFVTSSDTVIRETDQLSPQFLVN